MHLYHLLMLGLVVAGCRTVQLPAAPEPAPVLPRAVVYAGVDSTLSQEAARLGGASFASVARQREAAVMAVEGRALTALADSLLGTAPAGAQEQANREKAVRAFNRGARALEAYADAPDSVRAHTLLKEARSSFEEALEANPYDRETHYWLARVYDLQARGFRELGAQAETIESLRRLAALNRDDHRMAALLAAAYERWLEAGGRDSTGMVGALWRHAAQIAIDDAALDPEGEASADSGIVFDYYVRSSRALVAVNHSAGARLALRDAEHWARTSEELAFLEDEHRWIGWDDGNLVTRKRWDALLLQSTTDPEGAAGGMEALLEQVTRRLARGEVSHRLALLYYETGREERAASVLQTLWRASVGSTHDDAEETAHNARVREDYGTVAYNIAQAAQKRGEMKRALAYLLQSEQTGFRGAPRAALEAAHLLRNNIEEALKAALRAERHIAAMEPAEQRALLRYLVDLYRRSGDRDTAMRYVERYRRLK